MNKLFTYIKICILLLILFPPNGGTKGGCQDPQFSQFYATPLYLNPAMTGNTTQGRIAGIYRNQWAVIPGAFNSYAFSYDHNLPSINSGAGLQFVRDKAGSGGLRFTDIAGLYAYHLNITRNLNFNAGIRAGYTTRDIDFTRLTLGDQLLRQGASPTPPPTTEEFAVSRMSYFDAGSGAIIYSSNFWFGTAFNHINKPNQSFLGAEARLPMKYSVHGGYSFPVKKDAKGHSVSNVTVAANYKAQHKWDQFDLGGYYKRKPLILGVWYRGIPLLKSYQPSYLNNEAVIFLAGVSLDDYGLSFGYSYDVTISRLNIKNTAGAHEISLIYEYVTPDYKKNKRKFVIPCTKF